MNGRTLAGVVLLVVGVALTAIGGVGVLSSTAVPGGAAASPTLVAAMTPSPGPIGASPSPAGTPTDAPTPVPTDPPATAAPTAPPSPTAVPSPTLPPDQAAAVEAFLAALVAAIRADDNATLVARLHPATIARYGGVRTCEIAFAQTPADPTYAVEDIELHPLAPWVYETDGLQTTIDEAWTIEATVTAAGQTARREVHLAPNDAGEVSWFSDCGTPPAP